jgi:hypothetical protein
MFDHPIAALMARESGNRLLTEERTPRRRSVRRLVRRG